MPKKINKTAYNLFVIIEFIMKNKVFSPDDIVDYLSTVEIFLYNKAVLKYLRSTKSLGFKFVKINQTFYKLISVPQAFYLANMDEDFLSKMISVIKNYLWNTEIENKKDFLEKLMIFLCDKNRKFFAKQVADFDKNLQKRCDLISDLQKYCKDFQRLKIIDINNKEYLIEPNILAFDYEIYLKGIDTTSKSNISININNITSVKQTPQKNKFLFNNHSVTLKITSKFAKSYNLKYGEKIISSKENELLIESFYEDKMTLFNNILRYMENCEIISPLFLREEFSSYVQNLLQIYDCQV